MIMCISMIGMFIYDLKKMRPWMLPFQVQRYRIYNYTESLYSVQFKDLKNLNRIVNSN